MYIQRENNPCTQVTRQLRLPHPIDDYQTMSANEHMHICFSDLIFPHSHSKSTWHTCMVWNKLGKNRRRRSTHRSKRWILEDLVFPISETAASWDAFTWRKSALRRPVYRLCTLYLPGALWYPPGECLPSRRFRCRRNSGSAERLAPYPASPCEPESRDEHRWCM